MIGASIASILTIFFGVHDPAPHGGFLVLPVVDGGLLWVLAIGIGAVVGGILSDAAETVLVGASVLRNTVGVFGMLTVLGICLVPFLQLGIHYLAYKLTAALTGTVSAGRVTGLIDSIGGAFGLVLGMTGACALLMLVSIVSAISVVTI